MNLDELLKVNSVRCTRTKVDEDLVEGEIYKVEGFNDEAIKIVDRNGYSSWHNKNLFETVLNNDMSKSDTKIDTNLNSVNDTDGVIPTFKVGDKVYCPSMLDGIIYTVKVNSKYPSEGCKLFVINDHEYCYDFDECGSNQYDNPIVYHATEENRQALQVLHPRIEFELPPKEKTLAEKRYGVIKKLYDSGDIVVVRYDDYESSMIRVGILESLDSLEYPYPYTVVKNWKFAYAVDRKGIEITEDVLNETV